MHQYSVPHTEIMGDREQLLEIVMLKSLAEKLQVELSKTKEQLGQEIAQRSVLERQLKTTSDELQKQILITEDLEKLNQLLQKGICKSLVTETQLLQTTSDLQNFFQVFPDLYFCLMNDGTILSYYTREISDLYTSPEEFLGKRIQDFLPPEIGKQFQQAVLQMNETNSPSVIEYSLSVLSGHKSFEARLLPITGNQIIAIVRDITQRKQAQEALQKAKEELEIRVEERTRELKASLKEKELLLKEIHHRVKNNLQFISSLLRLQAEYIKDKQALDVFQDSQNRIRSMAMIHENLYQSNDLGRIDFSDYIRKLANNLIRSYEVNKIIKINLNIDNLLLRIDTAIPCGLIINELVSNAIKYAFIHKSAGEIYINFLASSNQKYTLTISDNGIGILKNIDLHERKSLGLQLVWNLVEQLEGTITFNSQLGTSYTITFNEQ